MSYNIYQILKDRIQGKAPKGARRSSKWRALRKDFLARNPQCAVCGGTKKVEVHHIVPFHLAPDMELDETNLLPLCERKKYGINCHLLIGHQGNYRDVNLTCYADARYWSGKLVHMMKVFGKVNPRPHG